MADVHRAVLRHDGAVDAEDVQQELANDARLMDWLAPSTAKLGEGGMGAV
jgi:hypothetical protein